MDLLVFVLMFRQMERRIDFLANCILYFDIRISSLSMFLNIDEQELTKRLYSTDYLNCLLVSNHIHFITKEEAEQKFLDYFNNLRSAYLNKDVEKYNELLHIINDAGIKTLKGKRKQGLRLTEQEFVKILKYQVKYRLPVIKIANDFDYSLGHYKHMLKRLEKKEIYQETISKVRALNDYNRKWIDPAYRESGKQR